jgi:hypothetical protein
VLPWSLETTEGTSSTSRMEVLMFGRKIKCKQCAVYYDPSKCEADCPHRPKAEAQARKDLY